MAWVLTKCISCFVLICATGYHLRFTRIITNIKYVGVKTERLFLSATKSLIFILPASILGLLQAMGLFHTAPTHLSILYNVFIWFEYFLFAQILRVQSSEGTKRIEILPSASLRDLYESIHDAFKLDHYNFAVYGERGHKKEISSSRSQTVEDFNLKHGDMLYMKPVPAGSSSVVCDDLNIWMIHLHKVLFFCV